MNIKYCPSCKKDKLHTNFYKNKNSKDGFSHYCKTCQNISVKKSTKKNHDKRLIWEREYRKKNREKLRKYHREIEYTENRIKYKKENKDKILAQKRDRYHRVQKHNPIFRLNINFSRSIRFCLKNNKNGRTWESLVGYTVDDLKSHLEKQFDKNMSWDNYGKYWHIDHIIPKSWFNYTSPEDEEFKKCWALSNLQPKEGRENCSKQDRFIG